MELETDSEFWLKALGDQTYYLSTDLQDQGAMALWAAEQKPTVDSLSGWELLAAYRRTAGSGA